jgi:membrane protein YqaA with SNARE-associated domain
MIVLKVVLVIYVLGLLLTAVWAYHKYWNKTALLSRDQRVARRVACVSVSLLWFAFFPKAIIRAVGHLAKG